MKSICFYICLAFVMAGIGSVIAGLLLEQYKSNILPDKAMLASGCRSLKKLAILFDRVTSLFPLCIGKHYIKKSLLPWLAHDPILMPLVNALLALFLALSAFLLMLLAGTGKLWYTKIMMVAICIILPFYIAGMLFDMYMYRINRNIPQLIDEFRSAFVKYNKLKPALLECSMYIDRRLGRMMRNAADSPSIEDSLAKLKEGIDNTWFNIFITLLLNYRKNSGDLISQLHKLNLTMTRYANVEKKKNKRLILYEIFSVSAAVFSIPAIFWLNSAILGKESAMLADPSANVLISRTIVFSIISLVVVRILKKF